MEPHLFWQVSKKKKSLEQDCSCFISNDKISSGKMNKFHSEFVLLLFIWAFIFY